MNESNLNYNELNAIAIASGPGLAPCLNVGLNKAKELSLKYELPLIEVNHIEAHALSPKIDENITLEYPYYAFIISGGHTQLMYLNSSSEIEILGQCIDDSIGESFDKVYRLLNDFYKKNKQSIELSDDEESKIERWFENNSVVPGKMIEEMSNYYYINSIENENENELNIKFPIPLQKAKTQKRGNFSFAGLKSAVARYIESNEMNINNLMHLCEIAFQFQYSSTLHLIKGSKVHNLKENIPIILAGGVASNQYIYNYFKEQFKDNEIIKPPLNLCTDNGVMIALNAIELYKSKEKYKYIHYDKNQIENVRYDPRWSAGKDKFQFEKIKIKF